MSLNESIVEDAALEWFLLSSAPLNYGGQVGDQPSPGLRLTGLGYAIGHGPHLAPGEPAAERDSFSEVAPFRFAQTLIPAFSHGEKEADREAIRRLNPANACGNPHPASPSGRGEEARATGKHYLQVRIERRQNT